MEQAKILSKRLLVWLHGEWFKPAAILKMNISQLLGEGFRDFCKRSREQNCGQW